jgi:hypothetical protein
MDERRVECTLVAILAADVAGYRTSPRTLIASIPVPELPGLKPANLGYENDAHCQHKIGSSRHV